LLQAVGLGHRLQHRPDRLSGGEQQRVSIAVALANRPPLLLADEPTGELDSIGADAVFANLRELNQRFGVTVIIVTHDPAIADRVDRVVTIRDGRLSTETVRSIRVEHGRTEVLHDDFAVVDNTGRLQIPREMLEKLAIGGRARLALEADRVVIRPDDSAEGR
jgi:ABC-type glutathione transport system ATPase component